MPNHKTTVEPPTTALGNFRICDFTGQLAGAGATKWLASFGADVIRIEDPVREGRWDILRATAPFIDDRRGVNLGGGFNNHNAQKEGITLNLRTSKGKDLLRDIIEQSDVVSENFAKGVLERWGFGFDAMREIKPDIIYVSNCGFGHVGPYSSFKTWGPIVQAVSGLTFASGLPDQPPAGWGYSYMDHTGAYYMAMAIMLALLHRQRTGEGQWVDLACTESALALHGPAILDWTVNKRPARRTGQPHSNRSQSPQMAPHGIYPCAEATGNNDSDGDQWIAIACRSDADWHVLADYINADWVKKPGYQTLAGRLAAQDALDTKLGEWTAHQNKFELQQALQAKLPIAAVQKPQERVDQDPRTAAFDLWPKVTHSEMGAVRVDGQPAKFSRTPWQISRGGPCLGEHTDKVLARLLKLSPDELAALHTGGAV